MTLISDTPNINNKWINLNFNRDINIYETDFIDKKQQLRGECFSQLMHTKTAWNYPWCNPEKHYLPTEMTSCAPGTIAPPTSDCGGNTSLCVPIQSACHVRRRKSCSGSGPRTCLPWFNTCNKLGIKTQEYTSQNQAKTIGVPRIKQNKMCCLQRHTLKPGLAPLAWLGLKVGLASIFDSKLTWPQILVWPQNWPLPKLLASNLFTYILFTYFMILLIFYCFIFNAHWTSHLAFSVL